MSQHTRPSPRSISCLSTKTCLPTQRPPLLLLRRTTRVFFIPTLVCQHATFCLNTQNPRSRRLIADGARLERGHTLSCGWIEAWRRESSVSTGSGSLGVDWGRNGHTVCSHRAVTHFRDISRKAGRNRPPCAMVSECPRFFWLCAHIIISVHPSMVSDRS